MRKLCLRRIKQRSGKARLATTHTFESEKPSLNGNEAELLVKQHIPKLELGNE